VHTARQLDTTQFAITRSGRPSTRDELLPQWSPLDRLGLVVKEPFGALGASHLIQLAITAFYDIRPERRAGRVDGMDPRAIYPEIFLFHVGGAHGDHSAFDFWPARKEVFVKGDARAVLDAINDRAITRLGVPDGEPAPIVHEHKEPAAARDRIASAFAYSASGRLSEAEWEVTGRDPRTEANPAMILDVARRHSRAIGLDRAEEDPGLAARSWRTRTEARLEEGQAGLELATRRREAIRDPDGLATESYRTITVDDALAMLG
jgi:hypothetical protein